MNMALLSCIYFFSLEFSCIYFQKLVVLWSEAREESTRILAFIGLHRLLRRELKLPDEASIQTFYKVGKMYWLFNFIKILTYY